MIPKEVSKFHSEIAKRTNKNNPRSKKAYQDMQKKAVASRLAKKKLSTSHLTVTVRVRCGIE